MAGQEIQSLFLVADILIKMLQNQYYRWLSLIVYLDNHQIGNSLIFFVLVFRYRRFRHTEH